MMRRIVRSLAALAALLPSCGPSSAGETAPTSLIRALESSEIAVSEDLSTRRTYFSASLPDIAVFFEKSCRPSEFPLMINEAAVQRTYSPEFTGVITLFVLGYPATVVGVRQREA